MDKKEEPQQKSKNKIASDNSGIKKSLFDKHAKYILDLLREGVSRNQITERLKADKKIKKSTSPRALAYWLKTRSLPDAPEPVTREEQEPVNEELVLSNAAKSVIKELNEKLEVAAQLNREMIDLYGTSNLPKPDNDGINPYDSEQVLGYLAMKTYHFLHLATDMDDLEKGTRIFEKIIELRNKYYGDGTADNIILDMGRYKNDKETA